MEPHLEGEKKKLGATNIYWLQTWPLRMNPLGQYVWISMSWKDVFDLLPIFKVWLWRRMYIIICGTLHVLQPPPNLHVLQAMEDACLLPRPKSTFPLLHRAMMASSIWITWRGMFIKPYGIILITTNGVWVATLSIICCQPSFAWCLAYKSGYWFVCVGRLYTRMQWVQSCLLWTTPCGPRMRFLIRSTQWVGMGSLPIIVKFLKPILAEHLYVVQNG